MKVPNQHPSVKHFESQSAYRRFLAYEHLRTPSGKRAKTPSQSISGRTPARRKTKTIVIRGKRHHPEIT